MKEAPESKGRLRRIVFALFSFAALSASAQFLSGCRALGLHPGGVVSGYAENLMASVSRQRDPEMVRQGFPTLVLLMDAIIEEDGENPDVLRAAANAYALYAQAFLVPREEKERAAILYAKAKDYGLRLLRGRSFYAEAENASFEEYEKALSEFANGDVPDIYAAANAWLGWILSQPDSMEALAEMPRALALMGRALDLDESHAGGGAHLVFGIYYAVQPPGAGRDLEKSRTHFRRALDLAGERGCLSRVVYAEFYGVQTGDEELFSKTLEDVVAKTGKGGGRGDDSLADAIARERAIKLLEKKGDYF